MLTGPRDLALQRSITHSPVGRAEGDLVVERSAGFTLLEAMSTKTACASMFDDYKRCRRYLARSVGPCPIAVIHSGNQQQCRGADTLIPWRQLHRLDW